MDDFRTIRVTQAPDNRVDIVNPTGYLLIGQGAQGAVFKLSGARCVKIYAANHLADMEYAAYQAAKYSGLVPKVYEKGANYIVMEYLKGPSLEHYLRMEGTIPKGLTSEILFVLKQMKLFQFTRVDCALRHLFLERHNKLKLIDLVHAYTIKETFPTLLCSELKTLGLLPGFLQQVKELDPGFYCELKNSLRHQP